MKKTILFISLILMLSATLQAQMNFSTPVNNPFAMEESFTDATLPIITAQSYTSRTTYVDIDGDGDKDCVAGISGYVNGVSTRYLENVGNASHPVFVDRGVKFPEFTGELPLAFADLDNDGDIDATNGYDYFENIGTVTNPVFLKKQLIFDKEIEIKRRYNTAFEIVEHDSFVGLTLADVDGDGDLDLFAGGFFTPAPIYFARNTGTASSPKFTAEKNNPFGLNTGAAENTLTFTDFDNDSDLDAVVGTGSMASPGSSLVFFRNTGSRTSPSFTNIGSNLFGLSMPTDADFGLISFTDIDNDGDTDAFLESNRTSNQPLKFYRNTTINTNASLLPQTINGFGAISQMIVGKEVYTINGVTGGASGNAVRFYSSNDAVVQVVNNTLVPISVGKAIITAVQVGNAAYSAAFAKQSVTIIDNPSKTAQTIEGFTAIPNLIGAGSVYTISGVTGGASGKPITYSSNIPSIARIEGNQIIAVSSGSCQITASQAGNNDFFPAASVVQTVKVGPTLIPQEISDFLIPNLYPGQSYAITGVTGGGSGNPIVFSLSEADKLYCSISGNVITPITLKSGVINLIASQKGNETYAEGRSTIQFRIVPDPVKTKQTITNFTFPSTPIEPESTIVFSSLTGGTSGNPVVFTADDTDKNNIEITGNSISFKMPGIYRIIATQAGSITHNPAIPVSRTVNVKLRGNKQYQQILNFSIKEQLIVGSSYVITGVTGGGSGNPIFFYSSNPAVASVSGNVLTMLSVGSVIITAAQDGNASYYPADRRELNLEVVTAVKIPQNIAGFDDIPNQVIGNTYTLNATGGDSGNPVQYVTNAAEDEIETKGNQLMFNKAGTFIIYASQAGNSNYMAAPQKIQLVRVNKKPQLIQDLPTIIPITVGGFLSLAAVTGGLSDNTVILTSSNPSVAQVDGNTIKGIAAGKTLITLWQAGNAVYETATTVTFEIEVEATLGIPDTLARSFKVYPNPVQIELTIELPSLITKGTIQVFNMLGEQAYSLDLKNNVDNTLKIDVSNLKQGIYIIKVNIDGALFQSKFIKK
jgi:hypothetical protein